MRFRAPDCSNASVLLADPNPITMKVIRDLCRECGVRTMFECALPGDLPAAVSAYAIDVFVLDQRVLDDSASGAWGILQARTGVDGVAPALALYGLPRYSALARARRNGIYCALAKPFSPNDFWARLDWLAQRAEPTATMAAVNA